MDTNDEVWKSCAPGYEVSNYGRVRSMKCIDAPKILTLRTTKKGYRRVGLRPSGQKKDVSVSRLVAMAFLGNPPPGKMLVLHCDSKPANNHVSNLRWGDHVDNYRDAVNRGTDTRGERSGCSKLTELQVIEILEMANCGIRRKIIAAKFGVSCTTIANIIIGHTWSHLTGIGDCFKA